MFEANSFRIFITVYSLFKIEHLSANIKLTLHKALIRYIITYASPTWEFAADNHLMKLQRTIGNFPRHTQVRDLHTVFKLPDMYDLIRKLCRQQAEVIQNHENENARLGEARHGIYKRLNLAAVKRTIVQVTR
jgi:hypothetical protein